MFTNPSTPNLADFVVFALAQGVPAADLPSVSPYPSWALGYALSVALCAPADLPKIIYVMAVYNLAYHHLLRTAQDQSGLAFFTEQRVAFNLFSFVAGPVASSGDDGTNQSLVIPPGASTKDPFDEIPAVVLHPNGAFGEDELYPPSKPRLRRF